MTYGSLNSYRVSVDAHVSDGAGEAVVQGVGDVLA